MPFIFLLSGCVNNDKTLILDVADQNNSDVNFNSLWVNEAYITHLYTDLNTFDSNGEWDGGFANSIYLISQFIDGGGAT